METHPRQPLVPLEKPKNARESLGSSIQRWGRNSYGSSNTLGSICMHRGLTLTRKPVGTTYSRWVRLSWYTTGSEAGTRIWRFMTPGCRRTTSCTTALKYGSPSTWAKVGTASASGMAAASSALSRASTGGLARSSKMAACRVKAVVPSPAKMTSCASLASRASVLSAAGSELLTMPSKMVLLIRSGLGDALISRTWSIHH